MSGPVTELYAAGVVLTSRAACRLVMRCVGHRLTRDVPQSEAIAAWRRLPKTLEEAKTCGLADPECDGRDYELAAVFLRKAALDPGGIRVVEL